LSPLDADFLRWQAEAPSPQASRRDFLVGLSVGQGSQPSAVAVLERLPPPCPGGSRSYACRYLRRWLPPGTAYPALVSDLTDMLSGTPLTGAELVVEAGPSIKAVLALLRKNRLSARVQPVEVKASAEDDYVEGLWRITKASVIETTRQVLQEDRLVFDERMAPEAMATTPSAQTIYHALLAYPYNKTPAANDAFASREGAYDDLILAVTLACWFGEHCRRTFWIR
jgi:hypothetical protein